MSLYEFKGAICDREIWKKSIHDHPTQQPTGTTATLPTITTSAAITGDHGRCSCGKPLEPNFDNGCQSFFYCEAGQAEVDCPPGTLFSLEQQVCDHANNVDCRRC
ncbi:hypothetical protein ACOME3_005356 [Neoechinorhynchus agilis]